MDDRTIIQVGVMESETISYAPISAFEKVEEIMAEAEFQKQMSKNDGALRRCQTASTAGRWRGWLAG